MTANSKQVRDRLDIIWALTWQGAETERTEKAMQSFNLNRQLMRVSKVATTSSYDL
jgi:hypothetical protein